MSDLPPQRVRGLGGVFFRARDPAALRDWYRRHLGIDIQSWGGAAFTWRDHDTGPAPAQTVWSIFDDDTGYFAPSEARFMLNFRVDDLDAMLAQLRDGGCDVVDAREDSAYGKFGWVIDPEGHKVELWEPPEVVPQES